MGTETEILEDLRRAIETWNVPMAKSAAQAAVDAGMEPSKAIETDWPRGW
jgi:hypothetical protein